MKTATKLAIWMDHAEAILMEFSDEVVKTKTIVSAFTYAVKEHSLKKSESLMHNKEQHQQSEYYKKLRNVIRNYDVVVIFGPTSAKDELFNILKTDNLLADIKIEVKHADKMTENQQHALIKTYFLNKISFN